MGAGLLSGIFGARPSAPQTPAKPGEAGGGPQPQREFKDELIAFFEKNGIDRDRLIISGNEIGISRSGEISTGEFHSRSVEQVAGSISGSRINHLS